MKEIKEVKLLPYPSEDNAILTYKNIRIEMSYTFMHHMIYIYSCGTRGANNIKVDREFTKALEEIMSLMVEAHDKRRKNK